jgi:hypothetical protein
MTGPVPPYQFPILCPKCQEHHPRGVPCTRKPDPVDQRTDEEKRVDAEADAAQAEWEKTRKPKSG